MASKICHQEKRMEGPARGMASHHTSWKLCSLLQKMSLGNIRDLPWQRIASGTVFPLFERCGS